MSTQVANAGTNADATQAPAVIAAKAKGVQQDAQAKGNAEGLAFLAKIKAILDEGAELGNIALDTLAGELGKSGSKLGRPSETAFVAFMSALAHRPAMAYDRRADLAKKANAKVNPIHKPVAVLKAKAASTQGTASYRFNAPASVEIALS